MGVEERERRIVPGAEERMVGHRDPELLADGAPGTWRTADRARGRAGLAPLSVLRENRRPLPVASSTPAFWRLS